MTRHQEDSANEESDGLGTEKDPPDPLEWKIPKEFDLMKAQLLETVTQALHTSRNQ